MVRTYKLSIVSAVLFTLALAPIGAQSNNGNRNGHAEMVSYQEVPTLSTPASGTLDVEISKDGDSLKYTLSYQGLGTHIRFSHIHIGRPAINGGVMVYLCNNQTPPPVGVPLPPACPEGSGTVTGTLTSADVLAVAAQGTTAGDFAAVVDALRAEAAYGNLHTDRFPGGEIRGQVTFHRADSINDD